MFEHSDLAASIRGSNGSPANTILTVEMDPGGAPQELITEYFLALDALYRSMGGSGLTIIPKKECDDELNR